MPTKHVEHRVGGWLPKDHSIVEDWIDELLEEVKRKNRTVQQLSPVIQKFQNLIERDAEIWMGFHQMFEQVPRKPPYNEDPTHKPQIGDYKILMQALDVLLRRAPEYKKNGHVGSPIGALLDWPMGTDGGLAVFLNSKVNSMLKEMFDVWAEFLTSSDSCYVLTSAEHGWFGPQASEAIPNFVETFACDPSAPYHGFKSWDDFFTRTFRSGIRPVELPDNDNVINNACESTVYCIANNIQARDRFWLKGQPYSLYHMLNNDDLAHMFVGGTVYQAYLSALNYHRWHSPVNGRIAKTVMVPGTYYAESPVMGFDNPSGPDSEGPVLSQSYLTSVATRALIFIEADNPKIGMMCVMAVGMSEVSTCEVTVKQGNKVNKGGQLGMFHFGGSTYCLLFRPQTQVKFGDNAQIKNDVKLNVAIAVVE